MINEALKRKWQSVSGVTYPGAYTPSVPMPTLPHRSRRHDQPEVILPEVPEGYVPIERAAQILNLTPRQIYRLIVNGDLHPVHVRNLAINARNYRNFFSQAECERLAGILDSREPE